VEAKAMKNIWLKKGLVVGIIVLFVGASVVPTINGDIGNSTNATDTAVATIIVPQPVLEIGTITGGFGIKAQIKNIGTANATNVSVNITLYGAWMILPLLERYHVILHNVDDGLGENVTVIVFGLGKTTIKVDATCAEGSSATKTATGTVFLFFMLGVK
jgi:hypothetical protein